MLFAFSSWLGKVWANRILESEKSKYSKELESLKHQYQISLNQTSIIHTSQKISFQNVIRAMHKYIKLLEQDYDERWQPIKSSYYSDLKKIIIEESLFLGAEGENALNIFLKFFGKSTYFPEDEPQSDRTLRTIYEHLCYIDERIREYFRKRIGLVDDEIDPLFEVHLIGACLLVSDYDDPNKKVQFKFNKSPYPLVEELKENIQYLCDDLKSLIKHIESEGGTQNFYTEDRLLARNYLNKIQNHISG